MISWLQGIFDSLSSFFSMVAALIGDFIDKLLEFFGYIKAAFSFLQTALDFLPAFYVTFAVIIVTVLIVYLILGRQSGGD